ncbi:hypothetical protein NKI41_30115, partial [Mesorhizobium sp. M0601]
SHDYRADMSARDMVERAVLSIARLLGRRVAREHFEELQAANDNNVHLLRKHRQKGRMGTAADNSNERKRSGS